MEMSIHKKTSSKKIIKALVEADRIIKDTDEFIGALIWTVEKN